jgi:hypothetical protein
MFQEIYAFVLRKTAFLYTQVVRTPYFFLDLWSIVHFVSGAALGLFLAARRIRRPFLVIPLLLVGYELVEIALTLLATGVFLPEVLPDQVTDVSVGMLGGFAGWGLVRRGRAAGWPVRAGQPAPLLPDLAVAVSVSTVWVAFYGYRYNVEFFNSHPVNWWAFLWWSGGLLGVLRLFGWLRAAGSPPWMAIPATWAAYVAILVTVEHVGYAVVGIREARGGGPLVFDVIHGTPTMKLFYAVAGLVTIGIASGVQRLARSEAPEARAGIRPGP